MQHPRNVTDSLRLDNTAPGRHYERAAGHVDSYEPHLRLMGDRILEGCDGRERGR